MRMLAVMLCVTALVSGCSSGDDDDTTAAPAPTETDAPDGLGIDAASESMCLTQVAVLETAVEAFKLSNDGALPATEAELVTEGLLVSAAEYADLDAAGTPVPAAVCPT